MSGKQLLVSPLASDVCIFCACRLQSRSRTRFSQSLQARSRSITTGRSSRQQAVAANTEAQPARHGSPVQSRDNRSQTRRHEDKISQAVERNLRNNGNNSGHQRPKQNHQNQQNQQNQQWQMRPKTAQKAKEVQSKRVEMPSFLKAVKEDNPVDAGPKISGWGMGDTAKRDVQFGMRSADEKIGMRQQEELKTKPKPAPLRAEKKTAPGPATEDKNTASTTAREETKAAPATASAPSSAPAPASTPPPASTKSTFAPAAGLPGIQDHEPSTRNQSIFRRIVMEPAQKVNRPLMEPAQKVIRPQVESRGDASGQTATIPTNDDRPSTIPPARNPLEALGGAKSANLQSSSDRQSLPATTTFRSTVTQPERPPANQSMPVSEQSGAHRGQMAANPFARLTPASDSKLKQDPTQEARDPFGISLQAIEASSKQNERKETENPLDNWMHLRRVSSRDRQGPIRRVTSAPVTNSMVDEAFDKYRAERDAAPKKPKTFFFAEEVGVRQRDSRRCARCGLEGHIARECTTFSVRSLPPGNAEESAEVDEDEAEVATPQLSAYDSAVQRTTLSKRFGDRPERIRTQRRSRDEDSYDDDRRSRDEYEDPKAARLRAARKAEKQARKDQEKKERDMAAAQERSKHGKPISLPDFITASNLAQALHLQYDFFTNRLESLGYEDVFANKVFNAETSAMIAIEFGFDPYATNRDAEDEMVDLKALPEPSPEDKEFLPARPPVVTIMGHVDHGKTTILDYLRHANVVAGEAGGITQHIGAFSVALEATGRTITFLDTPGHAAFLAMRQRGANVTDIVVLVVAADDSVKPQTLEALKHARGAGVPIIVAINKVDKPEADIERVKQDLARHDVDIEDYGGETQVVRVSGKTGQGMTDLEEAIVTQSEILDHRADQTGTVEGWVIEATTKERGRVATVLVRRGTMRVGTVIVAGRTWAKVKSLYNDAGKEVQEAGPGIPIEIDGWREQPIAGDEVLQAESEQQATDVVDYRNDVFERKQLIEDTEAINEARVQEQAKREQAEAALANKDAEPDVDPEAENEKSTGQMLVPFIIKADVSGSAEAVAAYIMGIASPLIAPQILSSAVGQINETDVERAIAAKGHIISFNLPTHEGLKALASSNGVKVLENNIIYRALDDVKEVLEEKLPPVITQKVLGEADILTPFEISLGGRKKMRIAGSRIRNGVMNRSSRVRVMRGTTKVYDGTLSSLKNVKKDVTEMRKGTECGIGFEDFEDFEAGDVVQTYSVQSEKRKL